MSSVDFKQLPIPAEIMRLDSDPKPRLYEVRFQGHRYSVIVSRDHIEPANPRWHVSVAGERTIPPWEAFAAIVHEIRPGIVFCQPLPPPSQWLNVDSRVLHAWEVDDPPLAAQWRAEGLGHQPT